MVAILDLRAGVGGGDKISISSSETRTFSWIWVKVRGGVIADRAREEEYDGIARGRGRWEEGVEGV